ncbi:hypothetical protein TELCIR_23354 [Teladorsagia circumcincta]|uniref:Uncharacterized protein n=1 Tax=Teladorsagia circumcincta TaxID=45464 RepID=A0A2G9TD05_TELCI|nr:hypothetical protein TELCIR_23354 [Teladorsagia circumcincta]
MLFRHTVRTSKKRLRNMRTRAHVVAPLRIRELPEKISH